MTEISALDANSALTAIIKALETNVTMKASTKSEWAKDLTQVKTLIQRLDSSCSIPAKFNAADFFISCVQFIASFEPREFFSHQCVASHRPNYLSIPDAHKY